MAKRTAKKSKRPATASTEIDAELAAVALEKRRNGERPTRDELAALRRHEAAEEEERRWLYYATIPKKHVREMSGRATEQLHRLADAYGFPLRGREIDLGQLLTSVFAFIEHNKAAIDAGGKTKSAELERLREEQRKKIEIANREKLGSLRNIEDVRATWTFIANTIRKGSEEIRQRWPEAADVLQESFKRARAQLYRDYPPTAQEQESNGNDTQFT